MPTSFLTFFPSALLHHLRTPSSHAKSHNSQQCWVWQGTAASVFDITCFKVYVAGHWPQEPQHSWFCLGGSRYVEGCWGFPYLKKFIGFLVHWFLGLSIYWFLGFLDVGFWYSVFKVSNIMIHYGGTLICSKNTKFLDEFFLTRVATRPKTIKLGGNILTC